MARGAPNPAAIDRVGLPQKIKCIDCQTVKNANNFSSSKQWELKQRIYEKGNGAVNAQTQGLISCIKCTPGQAVELECSYCDRTLAITRFSASQRRNGDDAKCEDCVRGIENTAPREEDETYHQGNDSDASDSSSEDGHSGGGGTTISYGVKTLSLTQPSSTRSGGVALQTTSTRTAVPSNTEGGVRLSQPSVPGTPVSSAGTPSSRAVTNSNRNAHGGSKTSSSVTASASSSRARSSAERFPKVPAVRSVGSSALAWGKVHDDDLDDVNVKTDSEDEDSEDD